MRRHQPLYHPPIHAGRQDFVVAVNYNQTAVEAPLTPYPRLDVVSRGSRVTRLRSTCHSYTQRRGPLAVVVRVLAASSFQVHLTLFPFPTKNRIGKGASVLTARPALFFGVESLQFCTFREYSPFIDRSLFLWHPFSTPCSPTPILVVSPPACPSRWRSTPESVPGE